MNLPKLSSATDEEIQLILAEWKKHAEKNNLPFAKYINTDKKSFSETRKLCEKIDNEAEKEGTDWAHYLAKDKDMRDILKRMMKAEIAYVKHQKRLANKH
ncbi:MAG: hypothetical protein WCH58_03465 [Candidatus Saccharibacteria bacterium]